MPTIPQCEAGWRMEPPVSDPRAAMAMPPATAAAEPLEEPPGTWPGAAGLSVAPYAEFLPNEPMANSSIFARPKGMAPAARRRVMAVASYGERKLSSMREAQRVGAPCIQMLYLMDQVKLQVLAELHLKH